MFAQISVSQQLKQSLIISIKHSKYELRTKKIKRREKEKPSCTVISSRHKYSYSSKETFDVCVKSVTKNILEICQRIISVGR